MTIEEIQNDYAIEQGFHDWNDFMNKLILIGGIDYHYSRVIQLIQYELKNKIVSNIIYSRVDIIVNNSILNTENIN